MGRFTAEILVPINKIQIYDFLKTFTYIERRGSHTILNLMYGGNRFSLFNISRARGKIHLLLDFSKNTIIFDSLFQ